MSECKQFRVDQSEHINIIVREHQQRLKPIPTNNFPKIPRHRKKRLSSYSSKTAQQSNAAKLQSVPKIAVQPTPPITISTPPPAQETEVVNRPIQESVQKSKVQFNVSNFLEETCGGNVVNLKISDIPRNLAVADYLELLELLKQEAIYLEVDIEKTVKIESPTAARKHVLDLERNLIKVMPLMNLLTNLVKFSHMHEEHLKTNPGTEMIVSRQKESIETLVYTIHQLEHDVLSGNCDISALVCQLEYCDVQDGREADQVVTVLTRHQTRMESLASVQTQCEEELLVLRREVQAYVGSNISSQTSILMLNIDTQLGVVMVTLSQVDMVAIIECRNPTYFCPVLDWKEETGLLRTCQ